jgi:predicted nucleotidyltransferase component of viral defense system
VFNAPDRRTLDGLSKDTRFIRDVLEKVYRLTALLAELRRTPDLHGKIALKGGTALQSIHLGFRRLSVDLDFNYVGSLDRIEMERDRVDLRMALLRLFGQQGYELDDERAHYSEHSFILAYDNSAGNRDRIKFEINYSERLPALDLDVKVLRHPFDALGEVSVLSYRPEELFSSKSRALLTRGTPRDLFDVQMIASGNTPDDEALYRKLLIFHLCMTPLDVREVRTERISDIDKKDVKRFLLPLLKKGEDAPELDEMKEVAIAHLDGMLDFTPQERGFLDTFYEDRRFDQRALFGQLQVTPNLAEHPAIVWRLSRSR